MARTEWIEYNEVEIVNLARTSQLAQTLGIAPVWLNPERYEWIEDALSADYSDITAAPWYDPGVGASGEFAGVIALEVSGLADSTLVSEPIEYTTDGGHSGRPRNETLPLVFNALLVASTERGVEFGKRWLDRNLRQSTSDAFCTGATLRYFRYDAAASPIARRRDVRLTRAAVVTRKRNEYNAAVWSVTWTMTAADPYEYGEQTLVVSNLGGTVSGPDINSSGNTAMTQSTCPVYDYSPIYDPAYPALVTPPTAPNFLPDGWNISPGMSFTRYWARIDPLEPSELLVVPTVRLYCTTSARRVRLSIWPGASDNTDQCDPLFTVVAGYVPANNDFYVDGESKASYVWDGVSPAVRRTDSLVFGTDATPVRWTAFNDPSELLVTLDIFSGEGAGSVRADISLTGKSD